MLTLLGHSRSLLAGSAQSACVGSGVISLADNPRASDTAISFAGESLIQFGVVGDKLTCES